MNDEQIRAVVKKAVAKHPASITLRKVQIAVATLLLLATLWMSLMAGAEIGLALSLAGIVSGLVIMAWNLTWVNTTLFRITHDETKATPPA